MSITGLPGQGPVRVGIAIADMTAGLQLAQGILIALHERGRSGEGQWVYTSLLEAQIMMLDFQAARWLIGGEVPSQAGNNHPTAVPTGVFRTSDGHINIAAAGGEMFRRMCQALDAPELVEHEHFGDPRVRAGYRDELNEAIEAITVTRPSAEWITVMNESGVPCGPINNIEETFADPQVKHLGIAIPMHSPSIGDTHVVGQAVNLSRTPSPDHVLRPTPELGEQTEEILGTLGYDADGVAALREAGVI